MSVTAVPVAAAGMHLAYARDGPVPGAAVPSVAGLALLTGGAVWRLGVAALGYVPADFGLRPVQAVDVVVALVIAGVLPRHAPRVRGPSRSCCRRAWWSGCSSNSSAPR